MRFACDNEPPMGTKDDFDWQARITIDPTIMGESP
jgi:hypothetical protein